MAAATLPAPGTKLGPCHRCEHQDCALTRKMAAAPCVHCKRPIGYETRFYSARNVGSIASPVYAHASCEEKLA